jgi:hypothetical protein
MKAVLLDLFGTLFPLEPLGNIWKSPASQEQAEVGGSAWESKSQLAEPTNRPTAHAKSAFQYSVQSLLQSLDSLAFPPQPARSRQGFGDRLETLSNGSLSVRAHLSPAQDNGHQADAQQRR